MNRRKALGFLCSVPLLALPLPALRKSGPVTVDLAWDWAAGGGAPIEYFEVLVAPAGAAASNGSSTVIPVSGHLRSCKVAVPTSNSHKYQARVRAVSAQGKSAFSAPIVLSA